MKNQPKPIDPLTVRERFIYDNGSLLWKNAACHGQIPAGTPAGCKHPSGYINIYIGKTRYMAHRLVWAYHHDVVPYLIDHINGNKADNRIENLRAATKTQNQQNTHKVRGKLSKYRGVTEWRGKKKRKRWHAQIRVNKKQLHIGDFNDEIEAAKAYNTAAVLHFGEFASLNLFDQDNTGAA